MTERDATAGPARPAWPVPAPWAAFGLALVLVLGTVWLFARDPAPSPTIGEQLDELAAEFPQDQDLLVDVAAPGDWSDGRVLHVDGDGRLLRVEVSYDRLVDDPDGAGRTRVEVDVCSARDLDGCRADDDIVLRQDPAFPDTLILLRDADVESSVAPAWQDAELRQR